MGKCSNCGQELEWTPDNSFHHTLLKACIDPTAIKRYNKFVKNWAKQNNLKVTNN